MIKKNRNIEELLVEIENELPGIIFRNWKRWRDVLPFAPRTVIHDDGLGQGPAEKIYMGRNVGYSKSSFMAYLRKKSRLA